MEKGAQSHLRETGTCQKPPLPVQLLLGKGKLSPAAA